MKFYLKTLKIRRVSNYLIHSIQQLEKIVKESFIRLDHV